MRVGRQAGIEGNTLGVTEQHGEACIHNAPRQAADTLAGDGQVGLMLGLVLADFGGAEDIVDVAQFRVQVMLVDAAVPGFGDHRLGHQATFGEMAIDECGQLTGMG
ncbi:hypothetical protein D3C73_1491210 [compost metagenome]